MSSTQSRVAPRALRTWVFWFWATPLPGQTGIELTGRGSGHGVGLSQWGARGLAAAGRDHGEILRYYYTGVVVGARP